MRQFIIALLLAAGLALPASAQNAAIQDTIGQQIEAFKADDFARAFTYASPTIQNIFRTPDNFGGMVRNGFPMVWRPADVRFLDLREIDGKLWQKVQIRDAKGNLHLLDYEMIEGENGWKINGVQILEAPGVTA